MLKIAHIINPFIGSSKHQKIQEITFKSISNALQYSNNLDVDVIAVSFPEDKEIIPTFIEKRAVIDQSVKDYNTNLSGKKLPLLADILSAGVEITDAEYIVFSNIDIGLYENFYKIIAEFINRGTDAFVINRRRVSDKYDSIKDLNQIYAEVGKIHTGYDCFVFKKQAFYEFNLEKICVGVPFVDSALLFNMCANSMHLKLFTNKHLTFHIGYELIGEWGGKKYAHHNKIEYNKVMSFLKQKLILKNIPGSGLPFFKRHLKWLMNPTIPYPIIAVLDFKQWNSPRYVQSKKRKKGYLEWLQHKVMLD